MGDNRSSIRHATTAPAFEGDKAHRSRLVDELHRNLHRRLILIAAPAGYGKTTTLSDFSEHTNLPVVWARLTPADQDATRLARLVWSGLTRRFRRLKSELDLDDHGGVTPEALAAMIASAVQARVPEDFVLILDDVHKVNESKRACNFISELISNQPDNMTAVVSGREVPRIPLVQLIAEDNLKSFGAEELALDLEELQAILAKRLEREVSQEQALSLLEESGGWVTAVLLSNLVTGAQVPALGHNGDKLTYEYLASNVFERQPERVQEFLLQSAALPLMTVEACNVALERDDSEAMLAELLRRSLFVSVTRQQPKTYEYHDLFREFILERPEQDEATRGAIQLRAADYFAKQEDAEQAFHLYIRAGEIAAARATAEEYASRMYEAGRDELIRLWVDALDECGSAGPHLLDRIAWIELQRGNLGLAASWIHQANEAAQESGDPWSIYRALSLKLDHMSVTEDFSQWDECINEALLVAEGAGHAAQFSLLVYRAVYLRDHLGEFAGALDLINRALEMDIDEVRPGSVIYAYNQKGVTLGYLSRLDESMDCFVQARAIADDRDSMIRRPSILNNISHVNMFLGNYEAAWSQGLSALEKGGDLGLWREREVYRLTIGELLMDAGCYEDAISYLRGALRGQYRMEDSAWLPYTVSRLSMAYRKAGKQSEALDLWDRFGDQLDVNKWQDLVKIEKLAMLHHLGPSEMLEQLSTIIDGADPHSKVHALSVLASKFSQDEDETVGEDLLRESLTVAGEYQLLQYLAAEAIASPELLRAVEAFDEELPREVADVLDRVVKMQEFAKNLGMRNVGDELPSTDLLIQALGQTRILGQAVGDNLSIRPKHIEAFFLIADEGIVSGDRLAEILWPNASASGAEASVHSAIYDIRSAFGSEILLTAHEGYRINDELSVNYDAHEFENAARIAIEFDLRSPEALSICLEAIDMYGGEFLSEYYSDWVLARRRQLEEQYIKIVEKAHTLPGADVRRLAMFEALKRALRLDPYRESLNIAYLKALAEQGRHSEARTHTLRYRRLLAEDLQLTPSADFEETRKRVLGERWVEHPLQSAS